jgi:hypothetical protein
VLIISDTASFLEFFHPHPKVFLPKAPPGMLTDYHDDLYTASMVGTFIGVFVFHNASIASYAHSLDQPYYPGDADQQGVMDANFDRYLHQNSMETLPHFKAAYDGAVARAHNMAPLHLPFSAFNSRLGAPIPTTPPHPPQSASYQYSPEIYPMSAAGLFSNVLASMTLGPHPTPIAAHPPTPLDDSSNSSLSSSSSSSSSGQGGGFDDEEASFPDSDDSDPMKNRALLLASTSKKPKKKQKKKKKKSKKSKQQN